MLFVQRLRWFFRKRWPFYVITMALIAGNSYMNSVAPRLVGDTIDSIMSGGLTRQSLDATVGLLLAIAVAMYLATYVWINSLFGSASLLNKELRERLLAHWTRMKPSFFQRNRSGELMALATNDVEAVSNTAGFGVVTITNTITGIVVVVVSMILYVDVRLMFAALLPMPLLTVAINVLGRRMRTQFGVAQQRFGVMNDHVLESISGLRVLRSYVQEEKDIEAFDRVTKDVMEANIGVARTNALFLPVISAVTGISFAIAIGYGSMLVTRGAITLGDLVTFNIYLGLLVWPLIAFGDFINILQRGNASVNRIEDSFAQQPDVTEPAEPAPVAAAGDIAFDGLTFRYPGSELDRLKDIRLSARRGETIGVVGKTGSGKSTLLKQLLRQYPIEPGRLTVSGVGIERIPLARLLGWIGYVPQEHMLLSRSIRDNIALGRPEATEDDIVEAARKAFLAEDLARMPAGLDTIVGENGVMLSGGQKQRIGIARALLVDPDVLVLDDALSAVDARTEAAILDEVRRSRVGKTTFIATHRLSAVKHAHRIVVLDDGRIVEEGDHDALMRRGGWYRRQYERQQLERSLLEEGP
ncbi:ABC transporter ATP-binding protein [Paenibacillus sp.]|uniref:ABC transporter ATP-binding protein n=1 Tax=Paenibacillus sp. TaxID=58172 RepID=UPI002D23F28C|nr:ABC transporter ATP-binding protein [Paenibacillus sp.]HZG57696.1 ABC transporter ATP-binding protein [Paenibacillus sp.]